MTVSILEDTISSDMARLLQEEIDWEVMCSVMQEVGWTKIETTWDSKSLEEMYEIKSWCESNLKGQRKGRGRTWLFELEKDATMFLLRWS